MVKVRHEEITLLVIFLVIFRRVKHLTVILCLHLYVREKMPQVIGIFCLSHFYCVRKMIMDLFRFAYLFTHLAKCTVIISIQNNTVISKNIVFSCFPKTSKYDLGNYAMRLTISDI